MERKIILNYNELDNYLTEWQKNPHRTDGQLTLLRDNCRNNLADTLDKSKEYEIVINELNWEITINWEKNLEKNFYMFPDCYDRDEKLRLYHQVKQALEEAESRWIYDKIFKEIS